MSKVRISNSIAQSDNLLDQSITLSTETSNIVELADEQLDAVTGGSQGYTAIDEGCFSVDNGGFAVNNGGFAVDDDCFSI